MEGVQTVVAAWLWLCLLSQALWVCPSRHAVYLAQGHRSSLLPMKWNWDWVSLAKLGQLFYFFFIYKIK